MKNVLSITNIRFELVSWRLRCSQGSLNFRAIFQSEFKKAGVWFFRICGFFELPQDFFSCTASGRFVLDFLKPKKSRQKKKKSRANLIIISSGCEEETNIERSWNFRPNLISVCEVYIPDWFCGAQVGHVKDGSIRSYRQGWRFVNCQGAQKPLEILMARGGTKYWRLTSYTQ